MGGRCVAQGAPRFYRIGAVSANPAPRGVVGWRTYIARMPKLSPKFTYANVAATLALVFSMSGGALAAGHYLINSKKQINPKVFKALEGAKGPKGATGAAGAGGPTGAAGATGATGLEGRRGPGGLNGSDGLTGEPGGTGPTGTTGPQGGTGPAGVTGEKGSEGKAGGEGKQGPTGERGATGEHGATGPSGERGPSGESGDALAYAHVSEEGDLAEAKNVGSVLEEEPGVFCLSGIVGTIHNVVATLDANEGESFEDPIIRTATGDGGKVCPEATQVTVETSVAEVSGGKLEEEEVSQGFFVVVN